jgi:SnoaL-like domain
VETDLRRLLDERDIVRVQHDYCRGIDRGDAALVASCYHEGGRDHHGTFHGPGAEFARYAIEALSRRTVATQHVVANTIVEFDDGGDGADVETYVLAVHHCRSEEGDETLERFGGRYLDRFERREGRWAIVDRLVVRDWDTVEPLTKHLMEDGVYPQGCRGSDDPLSRRPPTGG